MEQLPVHVVATIVVCSSLGIVGFVVGGYVIYLGYYVFWNFVEDIF